MADEAQIVEAGLPAPAPESDTTRHDNARTRALQGAFLAKYAQCARVDLSAAAADIARSTHYRWLETDPDYPALFAEADQLARQFIMDLAVERATSGWAEPVFYEGKQVATKQVFSERLLERLLEAKFPEFRRHHVEVTGKDGAPLIPLSALDELLKRDKDGQREAG